MPPTGENTRLVVKNTFLEFDLHEKAWQSTCQSCGPRRASTDEFIGYSTYGHDMDSIDTDAGSSSPGTDAGDKTWEMESVRTHSSDTFSLFHWTVECALLDNVGHKAWNLDAPAFTPVWDLAATTGPISPSHGVALDPASWEAAREFEIGFAKGREAAMMQSRRRRELLAAQQRKVTPPSINTEATKEGDQPEQFFGTYPSSGWPHSNCLPRSPTHGNSPQWSTSRGRTAARAPMPPRSPQQKSPLGASPQKQWSDHKAPTLTVQNAEKDFTTVMLRNLPNDYKRDMLMDILESQGFAGCFDFVYLPFDFKKHAGLGYAFVNLVNHEEADRAMRELTGFRDWKLKSHKVLEVTWSKPLQGLDSNIERYKNSSVMHPDVPDQFKPLLLADGVPVAFPPPTRSLQSPAAAYQ
jgi:hypothetical protein